MSPRKSRASTDAAPPPREWPKSKCVAVCLHVCVFCVYDYKIICVCERVYECACASVKHEFVFVYVYVYA